ncbi:MAG: SMC-Scp complex subunit ScpB [candidate division WOR-3 bacterium]|nr:SMC-Scp complex subunit ScpB [candidate division WOR-3 bacterium]MCX7757204.1 SMC-Scp complex subunit ScpB [candidate division WOR-3 bacterium]MDW7987930.1 SMC-Scp complex subunit ScpB [candidate division WOR-3 bacterium]
MDSSNIPVNTEDLTRRKKIVEALLFSSSEPLTLKKLSEITQLPEIIIIECINELNKEYELTDRSFRIEKVANGFQLYTLPEFGQWVRRLYRSYQHKLSKPALEVLAIIAYNQPITKGEIERVRGVDCSGPILTLLEKKLIHITGRAQKPGRPFLYSTTKEFLRYFGLASLEDLPRKEEIEEFLTSRALQENEQN